MRPGALNDDPGTGRVRVGETLDRNDATIPREDTAATRVETLTIEETYRGTFEVLSGDTPIETALRALAD